MVEICSKLFGRKALLSTKNSYPNKCRSILLALLRQSVFQLNANISDNVRMMRFGIDAVILTIVTVIVQHLLITIKG